MLWTLFSLKKKLKEINLVTKQVKRFKTTSPHFAFLNNKI